KSRVDVDSASNTPQFYRLTALSGQILEAENGHHRSCDNGARSIDLHFWRLSGVGRKGDGRNPDCDGVSYRGIRWPVSMADGWNSDPYGSHCGMAGTPVPPIR